MYLSLNMGHYAITTVLFVYPGILSYINTSREVPKECKNSCIIYQGWNHSFLGLGDLLDGRHVLSQVNHWQEALNTQSLFF